jgi:hypothetical protein
MAALPIPGSRRWIVRLRRSPIAVQHREPDSGRRNHRRARRLPLLRDSAGLDPGTGPCLPVHVPVATRRRPQDHPAVNGEEPAPARPASAFSLTSPAPALASSRSLTSLILTIGFVPSGEANGNVMATQLPSTMPRTSPRNCIWPGFMAWLL